MGRYFDSVGVSFSVGRVEQPPPPLGLDMLEEHQLLDQQRYLPLTSLGYDVPQYDGISVILGGIR